MFSMRKLITGVPRTWTCGLTYKPISQFVGGGKVSSSALQGKHWYGNSAGSDGAPQGALVGITQHLPQTCRSDDVTPTSHEGFKHSIFLLLQRHGVIRSQRSARCRPSQLTPSNASLFGVKAM